ncbi:hypothetical protein BGZ80_009227 [Entomortierella chlamydospora]|uniref:Uncharacterized protein n=1 Tax=Entomortierella chlamydospora TaxID=101097 RepID=A0A9P6MXD8_9FUNG|nr:hypothetical protein BGZ79_009846 [Entomortierella chlamydospora]KAG0016460.1 hypothetical protein BGZ80_009227 [Entomortierella chlamydospora]
MSQENNPCSKSVQFSRFIKISFTYPGDEYDRTALEPAKLTFSEATELMQLRIDWKQEMNRREQQRQQQLLQEQQDSEDGYSSDEARVPGPSRSSSCSSSPALSHQSLSSGSSSSPSSEDEYEQGHRQGFNGSSGMMHRHSHLQSKENMPCLA